MSEYLRSLLRDAQQAEEDARPGALMLEGLAGGAEHSADAGILEGAA